MALKLNIGETPESGSRSSRPVGSAVEGLPADSSGSGYHHSAAHDRSRPSYSAGDVEELLALRRLSPPTRKISEFSTSRSTMAVAMVVL